MITLTRLNGPEFALNCDLIERIEATPDTVLILIDGKRYVVVEPVEEVIARVRTYRAGVIALAERIDVDGREPALRLVHHTPASTGEQGD